jgi:NADP-dependent 3-hydroxy acid dehydrogenase YdfG/acyl carrier protein
MTRGGVGVAGVSPDPLQAAFQGLGRVARLEYPGLFRGIVDLELSISREGLARLLAFIAAPCDEHEVALRGDRLFVPRLERLPLGRMGSAPRWRSDAAYLITGGTGALGLALAESLARAGVRHLCLAGRNEPTGNGAERIAALAENGVRVTFTQADASLPGDLERLMTAVNSTLPPLAGLFHLAGELDDSPLSTLDKGRFKRSLGAKAAGAWHLHRLTAGLKLDHFVLFSSAAALLGNRGQGGYCAANAFLDGLAQLRRSQGLPGVSIAWGPLSGGGMAESSASVVRQVERQGFGFIPAESMFPLLEKLLGSGVACAAAIECDWNRYQEASRLPAGGFLAGLVSQEQHVAAVDSSPHVLQELQSAPPAGRKALLISHLQQRAGEVIGLPPERLDSATPLVELGLDSLMAVDLRNTVVKDFNINLTVATLFNIPTLAGLAGHLLDEHLAFSPGTAPVAAVNDLAGSARDLLAELKSLTG